MQSEILVVTQLLLTPLALIFAFFVGVTVNMSLYFHRVPWPNAFFMNNLLDRSQED